MILTSRLRLIPGTAEMGRAELETRDRFAALVGARVPDDWPPPLNDEGSMKWFVERIEAQPDHVGWYAWYFVARGDDPVLIGNGGFKGPPDSKGVVETGYSIIPRYHRQGFATEAITALVRWAFDHDRVTRVIAHTLPDLTPSIGVLRKIGFVEAGAGEEEGTIRFDLVK
jgi:RimJ/RimL family protein N-acetyltransferase